VAAVAVALLVGAGLGAVNALISLLLGIDTMVVTLGTLSIYGGYAFLRTEGTPVTAPGDAFATLGRGSVLGIPIVVLVFAGTAIVLWSFLRYTRLGQECFAVGDNVRAASLAGVRVVRVTVFALAVSGIAAALGGIMLAANAGQATAGSGERFLLVALAAVVVGGTSLGGGMGSIGGTVLGVLFLGTIDNGLNLLSVSSFWQQVLRGSILIGALALDQLRRRSS
jgi:ribose/xylose/arabinose/galactoside ABC-type transport system permease subunit